jgi:menaquinone-9 beta-reductase
MVLAEHGLTTVACCIRADQLALYRARAAARTAGAVVEAYLQDQCPAVREALQPAVRIGPWLAAGPIRPGVRLDPGDPPVFRVGNAAGEAHPIIGEGISMALQSAWLLCNQLLQYPGVLDCNGRARRLQRRIQGRYTNEWQSQFGVRLRLASVFAHCAMHPALWTPGLALLHRAPELLTRAARWSGKIRCAVSVPA